MIALIGARVADGLGPGGYRALGNAMVVAFVVVVLFGLACVALIVWLVIRLVARLRPEPKTAKHQRHH